MRQNLRTRIEELKFYDEKPIGIFGARASGKTIFFTVLYGLSGFNTADEKFSVICDEPESRKYLKKNYTYLLDGKLPPRTEINDITKIDMNYFYNNSSYVLRSFDFAGELLKDHFDEEKPDKAFLELQDQIYAFFANCSGILVFIEPNPDKKEGFERQTEIDKLLGFLKDYKGKWGFDIPMGLVITKWDKVSEELLAKNLEKEEYKVESYVAQHNIYRNVYSLISGVSKDVKIFPVSAFGKAKENDLPPDDLKPFNLFSPLVWIAQTRDKEWKDKIVELLKEKLNTKEAKEIVDVFVENVENKELLKEVNNAYKKHMRKKKSKKLAVGALILGGVLGISYYLGSPYIAKYMAVNNLKKVSRTSNDLEKVETMIDYYEKYKNKDGAAMEYFEKNEEAFKEIIEEKIEYPDKKIKYADIFLEIYPDSLYRKDIQTIKAYTIYQKNLEKTNDNYEKYKLAKYFASEYPNFKELNVVKAEMTKYLKFADREKYEEIIEYSNINQKDMTEVFKKIQFYLSVEDFTEYRKEINELKELLDEEFNYKKVNESLSNYNKTLKMEALKDLELKVQNYNSNTIIGKYETEVRSISKQLEALKNGISGEAEIFLRTSSENDEVKKASIKITIGTNDQYLTTNNMSENEYMGSFYEELSPDTVIDVRLFVTENGADKEYTISDLNLSSLSDYIRFKNSDQDEVGYEFNMKVNKNNYKIK